MSGLEIPDAYDRAKDEPAFSNSTEWEIWSARNCEECAHDGMGIGADQPQCPLILVALCGRTPAEWTDKAPPLGAYTCAHFTQRPDDPEPAPRRPAGPPGPTPGQLDLFAKETTPA